VQGMVANSNYLIQADNGGLALASFEFPGNQPPTEGQYTVTSATGALAAGKARVTFNVTTQSPFTATTGTVYVALNGTTTMVSFCGVTFTSTNNGAQNTTGGANIMWKP